MGVALAPAYDLALARPTVHDIQHVTLLTAYGLYWRPFVPFGHAVPALRSGGARALYLVAGGSQSAVLGALLAFARTPLYAHYVTTAGTTESALNDQEVGGMIMLLSGAVVFAVAAALTIRED
jgi:putative membrane protein